MPVASHPIEAVEIFCSYAHKDESLRDELAAHLSSLKNEGKIKSWHDRLIKPGENWKGRIDEQLETAHIILLLISADFINSDYCQEIELRRAMQRYAAGEARVIPVILRPCDWETSQFGELQALPKNALPVIEWPNHDAALTNAAKGIRAVVDELLGASPSASASPTVRAETLPRTFIPRPPVIGFVARRDAAGRDIVESLSEKLAPAQNNLVTLSGPGGVGKTTLAAETARELIKVFGGRIVWSSAEGRADFALFTLLDDISAQLGREDLRPLAPDAKEAQVYTLIADSPTLVVLDNYETIKPDARQRIEEWFAHAQCSALFTSRQKIGTTVNVAIAAMSREEAEEFLEKVIAQTQDAQIFSAEVRQRIYETAEANPYVMQWVVGQIDAAQEPQTVLEELAHGAADAATRVFDRSFNLPQLGDDGRAALLALSLFAPSATREALASVAGFGDDLRRLNEAVKNLRALWLIKAIDANSRFTVEGLTRSFSIARLLKSALINELHKRFVVHFLDYAEAHSHLTGKDFDALEIEKDNLLNAINIAYSHNAWRIALQIVNVIATTAGVLEARGDWDTAINCNERVRDEAITRNDEHTIAVFAQRAGITRELRGEYDVAETAQQQALSIFRKHQDESNIVVALHHLGNIAHHNRNLTEALRFHKEAYEIEKRLGDKEGIGLSLSVLGTLAVDQGHFSEAHEYYEKGLEILKEVGRQDVIALTLLNLGSLAEEQGNIVEAQQFYVDCLNANEKIGDKNILATTLNQMALIAEKTDKAEAARLFRESLSIFEKLGSSNAEIVRQNMERLEGESS